jgi:hypothetical protein
MRTPVPFLRTNCYQVKVLEHPPSRRFPLPMAPRHPLTGRRRDERKVGFGILPTERSKLDLLAENICGTGWRRSSREIRPHRGSKLHNARR